MSITKQYPSQNPAISTQNNVAVQNPAASPSGTLVSEKSLTGLSADKPAILGTLFGAGMYLVILSLSVSGNPSSADILPGLAVSYGYYEDGPNNYSVNGPTFQGSDLINGFTASESVQFLHSGEGAAITAGTTGGKYTSEWTYSATVSIYKL
jgi:hypothetical protein